jgi:prevent-host-death family protein
MVKVSMTIGVRQAKTELTKLIGAAMEGETVVITNHGKPLVRLVPEGAAPSKNRGYGCLKGAFEIPDNWDQSDAEVEGLFEYIQDLKKSGRSTVGR